MTRFVILTHYEATPKNKTHFGKSGSVQNWFSGKNWTHLNGHKEVYEFTEEDFTKLNTWMVKDYGYKTKASATRGLNAHQELAESETKGGYWRVSCKIIEMSI